MSNPNPPAPPSRAPRGFLWIVLAALAAYGTFLAGRTAATAGGSDSAGYLNSARLLAAGRLQTELRLPPEFGDPGSVIREHFTPMGFMPARDPGRLAPLYPSGLPLHLALFARLFGPAIGPTFGVVAAAVGAVWLCYLAGRELGLTPLLSASGAVMLGAFPVFLFTSIQALSDTLATTSTLASFYFGLRARRSGNWALGCGAAYGFAVLVRPTNLLFGPALLILLGLDWPRLARFIAGGLPTAAWLLVYNTLQYGGPLESGYGEVASGFNLVNGVPTLLHFVKWLALLLPTVVLALPVVAARASPRRRELLALGTGFAAIVGLYLFYDVSQEVWWCLRFILPVVPALILAALLGVEALAQGPGRRWPRAFQPAAAGLLSLWAIAASWYWSGQLHLFLVQMYEQRYEDAARVAVEKFPADALVCANAFSGTMYYYTHFPVLRSDVVFAPDFKRYAEVVRAAGRPLCAIVFDFEEEEFHERCPGQWTRIGEYENVRFWRLD